jgi:hypothetical protein
MKEICDMYLEPEICDSLGYSGFHCGNFHDRIWYPFTSYIT